MENFLLPDEIILKILGYLGLSALIQCAKVSKRFNTICKDKSLSYRSSTLVMKDLTVNDQKYINAILIARPYMKKVTICSISCEGVIETKLSEKLVRRIFLGPKSCCMKKKKEVFKALGASVRMMYTSENIKNVIELGLFYFMPICKYEFQHRRYNCRCYSNLAESILKINWIVLKIHWGFQPRSDQLLHAIASIGIVHIYCINWP